MMNTALPTGSSGRALALGLLGGVLLLGWLAIAAPLLTLYQDRAEELADRQLQARRMESLAASLPALQRAAATQSPDDAAPALLEGNSDAIAAAAMQGLVRDMAGRVEASLFSVETLPAAPAGAYRRIGLRVALAAPWPVLVRLLQALEQARPRMVIDDLELHNSQIQANANEVLLNAAFTIYAFRGESSPRASAQ